MSEIDDPKYFDNRSYNYTALPDNTRREYSIITGLVSRGANVVDLGCGNGSLLQLLIKEKDAIAAGVEISESGVLVCRQKGLNVTHGRIDDFLPFADDEFDFSICNVTIQMVLYPEVLLKEMKRISRFQIVSFPNFAFIKNRFDLLLNGRMPKPMMFGYEWYNTGHIHQFSVNDFLELVKTIGGLNVRGRYFVPAGNSFKNLLMRIFPNLFQQVSIFQLAKQ